MKGGMPLNGQKDPQNPRLFTPPDRKRRMGRTPVQH